MTDCRLTISSRGAGWESNNVTRGRMHVEGGCARIEYALDGDDCTLFLTPRRIEQTRRGEVNIKLSFVCGSETACILGEGGAHGGYAIFTERLSCLVGSKGASAEIDYLSGDDREKIKVKIRAFALAK